MTKRFTHDTYVRPAVDPPSETYDTAGGARPAGANTRIRDATAAEAAGLEALQRRPSAVWDEYRDQLVAHPDAIGLPRTFIDNGWVRVAAGNGGVQVGFSGPVSGG